MQPGCADLRSVKGYAPYPSIYRDQLAQWIVENGPKLNYKEFVQRLLTATGKEILGGVG